MSQQSGTLARLTTQAVKSRMPTSLSVRQHTKPEQQKDESKPPRTLIGRLVLQRRSCPDQSLCTQSTWRRIHVDIRRFARSRLLRNAVGANIQLKSRHRYPHKIAVARFTSLARKVGR